MILNMMVIPCLALTNGEQNNTNSLFQYMLTRDFNITRLLGDFYLGNNGIFFVSLIV
jgi:uncharacterized membrane protein YciS (DUF1049 family)